MSHGTKCDGNLLGENTNITKKNTVILNASKEVGLEVNAEKNNMHFHVLRPDFRTKSTAYIKVAYKAFEYEANFKYLRTTLTNRGCIHEEIKRRVNS
jgi:hypothetical protein